MLITIIIFVVVLSLMVFVHELGHFTMARKFKVRVDEFGLGLPPRMLGLRWNKQERLEKIAEKEEITVSGSETESVITDKIQEVDQLVETKKREWIWGNKKNSGEGGGTIYSLNWIPVGGFVTMVGENGGNANNPESFSSKKIWQRAVILVAGVTMNMILCMILLSLGFFIGMPQVVGPETKGNVTETKIQVLEVVKDLPAAQSGIQAGDALVSIDNQSFKSIDDLRSYFAVRKDQSVAIKIKRNNEE
ncbi:MAG: site-2 protease family protein, partial [Patescibacteria group bacterium]